jgi:hypothetical protein
MCAHNDGSKISALNEAFDMMTRRAEYPDLKPTQEEITRAFARFIATYN